MLYVAVACLRLHHPFELEWLEGLVLDHVRRVLLGRSLYVEPSLSFVPNMHTPLYYYVCAPLLWSSDGGFAALRSVSFAASLGSLALIQRLVERETASRLAGVVALGLFAASFGASGGWFDLARVDSLFLFWTLAALYCLRFGSTTTWGIAAGALATLAVCTKQSALVVFVPLVGWGLAFRRRSTLPFALTSLVLLGACTFVGDRLSGGWLLYYTVELPSRHPIHWPLALAFWTAELGRTMAPATLLTAGYLAARHHRRDREGALFYTAALLGMVGASWAVFVHAGAWDNDLMPAHAILAAISGMAWAAARDAGRTRGGRSGWWLSVSVSLALALQFALLWYPPSRFVPTSADADAGRRLVATIRGMPGEVWVPGHGYLAARAGRPGRSHAMPVHDVVRHDPELGPRLADEIRRALVDPGFDALILDDSEFFFELFREPVSRHYSIVSVLFDDERTFVPVSGYATRPQRVWERVREPGDAGARATGE